MIDFRIEPLIDNGNAKGLCIIPDINDSNKDFDTKSFLRNFAKIPVQTHSLNVGIVKKSWENFEDTDALVTFEKDISIGICTADCVPILIYAPDAEGVAAVHAGWKGTLGGIIDNTLDVLIEHGAKPENLYVAFGPSISKSIYEVDEELAEKFKSAGFGAYISYSKGIDKKPHIDLQGVNVERLLRRGAKKGNIQIHQGCSYDSKNEDGKPLYHSYRRSKGSLARMLTSIMLADN